MVGSGTPFCEKAFVFTLKPLPAPGIGDLGRDPERAPKTCVSNWDELRPIAIREIGDLLEKREAVFLEGLTIRAAPAICLRRRRRS